MKRGKGLFIEEKEGPTLSLLSRRKIDGIEKKGNDFEMTTTRKRPPHHLPLFFLDSGGEFTIFFMAFLSID